MALGEKGKTVESDWKIAFKNRLNIVHALLYVEKTIVVDLLGLIRGTQIKRRQRKVVV